MAEAKSKPQPEINPESSSEPNLEVIKGNKLDRQPFWRRKVNTEPRTKEYPSEPTANLEREGYYTKNKEIEFLIDAVNEGDWEASDRGRRLRERYGEGTLGNIRAWLGGEKDIKYDRETGEVDWQWATELARRLANVGWKTATSAGIAVSIGALIGSATLSSGVLIPALAGAAAARSLAQAYQMMTGKERGLRTKLEIARARQYDKAKELAVRVIDTGSADTLIGTRNTEETAEPISNDEAREDLAGTLNRDQAIRDLVNFVHESEQNTVIFAQKETGELFVNPQPANDSIETPIEPLDRMGTEVYQESDVAPGTTIDEMQQELEAHRRKMEWIEEGLALAGGLYGSIHSLLTAKARIADQMIHNLENGQTVKLNIDGDKFKHGVHMINNLQNSLIDHVQNYVYDFNTYAEALKSHLAGGTQALQEGTHALGETAGRVLQAIDKEAVVQTVKAATAVIGGLVARFAWRGVTNEKQHDKFEEDREEFKQEQEILRRRLQPDSIIEKQKQEAKDLYKDAPEKGQTWRRFVPNDDSEDMREEIINITEIDKQSGRARIKIKDPDGIQDTIRWLPINEIYQNYELVEREADEVKIIQRTKRIWQERAEVINGGAIPEPGRIWIERIPGAPDVFGQTVRIESVNWLKEPPMVNFWKKSVDAENRPIQVVTSLDLPTFLDDFARAKTDQEKDEIPGMPKERKVPPKPVDKPELEAEAIEEETKEAEPKDMKVKIKVQEVTDTEVKSSEKEVEIKDGQIYRGIAKPGDKAKAWKAVLDPATSQITLIELDNSASRITFTSVEEFQKAIDDKTKQWILSAENEAKYKENGEKIKKQKKDKK